MISLAIPVSFKESSCDASNTWWGWFSKKESSWISKERMPTIMISESLKPVSRALALTEAWDSLLSSYISHISACASKWIIPIRFPWWNFANACFKGMLTEWSPPKKIGNLPLEITSKALVATFLKKNSIDSSLSTLPKSKSFAKMISPFSVTGGRYPDNSRNLSGANLVPSPQEQFSSKGIPKRTISATDKSSTNKSRHGCFLFMYLPRFFIF